MRPENLASGIKTILEHSPAFPKAKLIVDIIANPKAGGFKRRRFADKRKKELAALVAESLQLPQRKSPVSVHLHLTERGGHAAAIVQRLLDRSESNGTDLLHLIITAGGDGTSLETAERLTHLPEKEKNRFGILRLPLGTGNDGSEGRDLRTALGRFFKPVRFERRPAVRVVPALEGGKPPLYAFNIASVGLDAYVADMTNRLKIMFPEDSYKFWLNVATLLYDKAYPLAPMKMRVWDMESRLVEDETSEKLFVALGSSGYRQYGSNKKILPGPENAIAVYQTPLLRRLFIKGAIEHGQHENLKELKHFSASRIELEYHEPILLQCDGETHSLANCDFPLTLELIPDLYNVVVPEI